ncbi:glycosyltransferase family 87 protein [Cryobacterium sp. PH31-L1]|uniref:glycosyltransferase family 87 protein n=1 Tax=Cryobacterium sp. PH31-L1 TaxID=3046199 RepID=UPI0024BA910D|nr:glycosyltransferase family 87 protein [Cryobacterium sp. PH31-L1]MDJ0377196.1 glycosyltransferase family 87 protein [Cryobacterium sp. PH31-L1]
MRITIIAALLVLSAALTAFSVLTFDLFNPDRDEVQLVLVTSALWLLFGLAFWLLRRVRGKAVVALILAGSALIGGAAMVGPPNTSTDSARYAWDGIVQTNGISPYAFTPADARLDSLRPDWLFPAPQTNAAGKEVCDGERIVRARTTDGDLLCSALNRTAVPTIYPPASEIFFAGVRFLTGPGPEYWPLQLAGLVLSLGTSVMLLIGMRRRGLDQRNAALWAWCPLVATEAITNSHVDMLGVIFVVAVVFLVSSKKVWRGGIMLGIAIGTKLIPVLAAPALLKRGGWRMVVASVLSFALLYLPYVLATGIGVLGYLPGYLTEEGYQDGSRFALVSLVAPGASAVIVAGVILAIVAGLVIIKTDQNRPWVGQLVMIGATLLVLSPRYPWYALLLLPFVALSGRWEWLLVPMALTLRLLLPNPLVTQVSIAVAVIVIVAVSLRRAGPGALKRMLPARLTTVHGAR